MRMTVSPIVIGVLGVVPNGLKKENGEIRNQRKRRDHPHSSMVKIVSNTAMSPRGLLRHAISQTPVRDE